MSRAVSQDGRRLGVSREPRTPHRHAWLAAQCLAIKNGGSGRSELSSQSRRQLL
jgi:hypothetical protein